jgi:hypothetical protein
MGRTIGGDLVQALVRRLVRETTSQRAAHARRSVLVAHPVRRGWGNQRNEHPTQRTRNKNENKIKKTRTRSRTNNKNQDQSHKQSVRHSGIGRSIPWWAVALTRLAASVLCGFLANDAGSGVHPATAPPAAVTTAGTPDQPAEPGIHKTAQDRRRIAIEALGYQLDPNEPASAAARLAGVLGGPPRPIVASGDIDGIVSAAMLASVVRGWEVVAIVTQSSKILVHPSVAAGMPDDLFGVDLFSTRFDNVSNHVVQFGPKNIQVTDVRDAFRDWDEHVARAYADRLLAVPAIWARTTACYEDAGRATSAKYKYPLGTAQVLLALLEAAGRPPRFYDRHYLPWLVANCDGGVESYYNHAYNASVWWPTMAAAVGPASLSEQVYQRVATMRPHDFIDAVNRLDRERQALRQPAWLNDQWNLVDQSVATIERTFSWLTALTGWRDPVRGGSESIHTWHVVDIASSGMVYIAGGKYKETAADPVTAAARIRGAVDAVNANFYMGGFTGSRFNWVGGW